MVGVLDRAPATTLSRPDMCCISFVNSCHKREMSCLTRGVVHSLCHGPNMGLMISEGCEWSAFNIVAKLFDAKI